MWINQPLAQNVSTCNNVNNVGAPGCTNAAAAGTLIPVFGSQISFNDPAATPGGAVPNTITGFASSVLAGPTWAVSSPVLDGMQLQNNQPPGASSQGTIFEFTGSITNTSTATVPLSITPDDGISCF